MGRLPYWNIELRKHEHCSWTVIIHGFGSRINCHLLPLRLELCFCLDCHGTQSQGLKDNPLPAEDSPRSAPANSRNLCTHHPAWPPQMPVVSSFWGSTSLGLVEGQCIVYSNLTVRILLNIFLGGCFQSICFKVSVFVCLLFPTIWGFFCWFSDLWGYFG